MGFVERLTNAFEIFKTSISYVGKDKSLIIVPIMMLIVNALMFVGFIILFFTLKAGNLIGMKLVAPLILYGLLTYFITTFLGSIQCWMVYEVAHDINTTFMSGFKRAMHNLTDILWYAIVSLLINMLISSLRSQRKSIFGVIMRLIADAIGIVTGIAAKIVLPAMIVTDRTFKESLLQLKESTKAIPEIATYEIGIRPLMTLLWIVAIVIAVIVGTLYLPAGIILGVILAIMLMLFSIFINNTYYTLLYLTLIEKKHIKGINLKVSK